jgi:hypothetical protein
MVDLLVHWLARRPRPLLAVPAAVAVAVAVAVALGAGASADAADPSRSEGAPRLTTMPVHARFDGGGDGHDGSAGHGEGDGGDGGAGDGGGGDGGDGGDGGGQGGQPGALTGGLPSVVPGDGDGEGHGHGGDGGGDHGRHSDGGAGGATPVSVQPPPAVAVAPPVAPPLQIPAAQRPARPSRAGRPARGAPAHRRAPARPRRAGPPARPRPASPPPLAQTQVSTQTPTPLAPRTSHAPARHRAHRAGSRTGRRRHTGSSGASHSGRPANRRPMGISPGERGSPPARSPPRADAAVPAVTDRRAFSLLLAVPLLVLLSPLVITALSGRGLRRG